jgi:hypothetical protein
MTKEANKLSISSKAYKLLEKLQLQENDGLMITVLALYWTMLHYEESIARWFGKRYTLNNDAVVRKLQVVTTIIAKVLGDAPSLHRMRPHLSSLKDTYTVNLRHVGRSIHDVLRECDIKDCILIPKLTVLVLCYWDEMLSEEECESAAEDPNWKHYLQTLIKSPEVKQVMQRLMSGYYDGYHKYC